VASCVYRCVFAVRQSAAIDWRAEQVRSGEIDGGMLGVLVDRQSVMYLIGCHMFAPVPQRPHAWCIDAGLFIVHTQELLTINSLGREI